MIKDIVINFTPDIFDDDKPVTIKFDSSSELECFTLSHDGSTIPISVNEIVKMIKRELLRKMDEQC